MIKVQKHSKAILLIMILGLIAILAMYYKENFASSANNQVLVANVDTKCNGDFNHSGRVDIVDFAFFAYNYNKQIDCALDITGDDCQLTLNDFSVFAKDLYGKEAVCVETSGGSSGAGGGSSSSGSGSSGSGGSSQEQNNNTVVDDEDGAIYLDNQLSTNCTSNNYSRSNRNCTGSDGNAYSTFDQAVSNLSSGGLLVIRDGIYRQNTFVFGPAGGGFNTRTIIRGASGERAILTRSDDLPPAVSIYDYVRVEGLWMGGSWDKVGDGGLMNVGNYGGPQIGTGKEIVNNTIFGYKTGINIGTSRFITIQGNRLIHNGNGAYDHGMYISGGGTTASNHIIVDNNVVVDGEGYGIHEYHRPVTSIITRNFVANHSAGGIVVDDQEALVANNFAWKMTPGVQFQDEQFVFINNILGPESPMWNFSRTNITIDTNVFFPHSDRSNQQTTYGVNDIRLNDSDITSTLGITESIIDTNLQNIDQAFYQSVQNIYSNSSIDTYFDALEIAPAGASALVDGGINWLDFTNSIDIGPQVSGNFDEGILWKLFREQGLIDKNEDRTAHAPAPSISNVSSQVTSSTATITWNTNESTDASVLYGTTQLYGYFAYDNTGSTNHSITLTNLNACTTYNFRARSRDVDYLITASEPLTFTTSCN
ncbi:right-handed parallel beta-helix repeat-containing protein [Candidatus Dojkabacteria bacterium]|uniref:Probable pectate lyase C n=1 Tax=Candidatus Dojkabacteria bacterium TaxID=2099670 RepID=A0A955L0A4_9BACT|nr:right-handed parallel beta-helix repeat-containing protein [Candidatus Dojkabacteria bacterium]